MKSEKKDYCTYETFFYINLKVITKHKTGTETHKKKRKWQGKNHRIPPNKEMM